MVILRKYTRNTKNEREHELREFIDSRIQALVAGEPSISQENLQLYILSDVLDIEKAIERMLQQYDFGHHIDLNEIMNAQPKRLYRKKLYG